MTVTAEVALLVRPDIAHLAWILRVYRFEEVEQDELLITFVDVTEELFDVGAGYDYEVELMLELSVELV